ncbi:MAG TPA: phosphoglycerate mutase family protein [Verrucomicrobiae bacterium]|nr:phosphoglycerate mutase family protein [Verrucomicrobiae bacterium]
MKEVIIVRHGNWNLVDDQLTEQVKTRCIELKPRLGSFAIAISSPFGRTQETARLLSGLEPSVDERAGILKSPPEFSQRVAKLRKTDPFGVAGAIISIPELREPLRGQGQHLVDLTRETLSQLSDDQRALIVSHDGTIAAAEKVLTEASFDEIDHTYGELEGFRIDETMQITRL